MLRTGFATLVVALAVGFDGAAARADLGGLPPPGPNGYAYINTQVGTVTLPSSQLIASNQVHVTTQDSQLQQSFDMGTLQELVYRENATGRLDFAYSLGGGTSAAQLDLISIQWLGPGVKIVDAGYLPSDSSAIFPDLIFQSTPTASVQFFFPNDVPLAGAVPGAPSGAGRASTALVVLRTTATDFVATGTLGFLSVTPNSDPLLTVIGRGDVEGFVPLGEGTAPVPELSSMTMVAMAAVALAWRTRRAVAG